MTKKTSNIATRRTILRAGAGLGAFALTSGIAPLHFIRGAHAAGYCNEPSGKTVTLGFNVPQTGAYADEGADELRAYKLAVKH